ncbi:MAG: group III truncated hemoglobin [Gammaproteobacteria bacterium]|nr:group III truncated hemoglobin [Gammaproteobacteria bacterium]
MTTAARPDLDTRERVEAFVDAFYAKVLVDPLLAPIFLDVAAIELDVHLPHIKDYWCKLLLGETAYRRHTMNIHRQLHAKRELSTPDFQRWLDLFVATLEETYQGPGADRARRLATTIAGNMQVSVNPEGYPE